MFLKEVSSAQQGLVFFIKNTAKTVILWNIFFTIYQNCFLFDYILKCNLFLWCKAEFSASLLQASVSHDPSEIIQIFWFAAQETFSSSIIINVENSFVKNKLMNIKFKRPAFIWNRKLL